MSPVSKPPLMSNSLLIPFVVIVEEVVLSLMVSFICELGVNVADGEALLVDEETLLESSDIVTDVVATDDDKELVREEDSPPTVVREAVKMVFDMLLAAEEGTTWLLVWLTEEGRRDVLAALLEDELMGLLETRAEELELLLAALLEELKDLLTALTEALLVALV